MPLSFTKQCAIEWQGITQKRRNIWLFRHCVFTVHVHYVSRVHYVSDAKQCSVLHTAQARCYSAYPIFPILFGNENQFAELLCTSTQSSRKHVVRYGGPTSDDCKVFSKSEWMQFAEPNCTYVLNIKIRSSAIVTSVVSPFAQYSELWCV